MMQSRFLFAAAVGGLLAVTPAARGQVEESGLASIYADELEGRLTASGQTYAGRRLTAAHRTLPFGTRLRVTDPASGQSVTVLVNDRWGGGPGKIVNLSRRAAEELGMGTDFERKVELQVMVLGEGGRLATPEEARVALQAGARVDPVPTIGGAELRQTRRDLACATVGRRHVRTCRATALNAARTRRAPSATSTGTLDFAPCASPVMVHA
jgi:rare lipoprotein A